MSVSNQARINEIYAVGFLARDPVQTSDGRVHFLMEASEGEKPFQCICEAKTAGNIMRFCKKGDEITIEGELRWWQFGGEEKQRLLIYVRFVSYGRKDKTLRPQGGMD